MLCHVCSLIDIESDIEGGYCAGKHHASYHDLITSAQRGCEMCEAIRQEAERSEYPLTKECADRIANTQIWYRIPYERRTKWHRASGCSLITFSQAAESEHFPCLRVEFGLFVRDDCSRREARLVHGREIHQSPDSDACYSLIQSWMANCLRKHRKSCPYKSKYPLPTRLIDVGTSDGSRMPVLQINMPNKSGKWIALSHCWGKENVPTTTSSNLRSQQQSIDFDSLPPTFRDAIAVTRRLGYQYIWIDSLCIIQDDERDWEFEASRMQSYYKHAVLTIAADSAAGDGEGFLDKSRTEQYVAILLLANVSKRAVTLLPKVFGFHNSTLRPNRLYVRRLEHEPTEQPLSKRAWTLQEDVLAPRTLHFSSEQLIWECQKEVLVESELDPSIRNFNARYRPTKRLFLTPPEIDDQYTNKFINPTPYDRWYHIVEEYCTRALTVPQDKFNAISGLAREIQKQTSATYRAGIWMEDLHQGLVWCFYGRGKATSLYRAPSFSWAALDAVIPKTINSPHKLLSSHDTSFELYDSTMNGQHMGLDKSTYMVKLIRCGVTPVGNDPYGRLKYGYIILLGYWLPPNQWAGWDKNATSGIFRVLPYLNRFDMEYKSRYQDDVDLDPYQVICSFDELPATTVATEIMFAKISFLQIARWQKIDCGVRPEKFQGGRLLALMLRQADTGESFKRVGIAEFPSLQRMTLNEKGELGFNGRSAFDTRGWQLRPIMIV